MNQSKIKSLLVDDLRLPGDKRKGIPQDAVVARTFQEGINRLQSERWDRLYLDHDLGDFHPGRGERTGMHVLGWLERNPLLPLLGLLGCGVPTSTPPEETLPNFTTVKVVVTPGGRVTAQDNRVDCGTHCRTTYLEGKQGVFWANPEPGFYLVRWDGACSGTLPYCIIKAQPGTHTVTIQAEFAEVGSGRVAVIAYSPVTFPVGGTICGQTCRSYLLGTYVSVLPDPPPGYRFVQWTQGPCWGSYTHKCSFQAVNPTRLSYDVLPDR